MLIYFYLAIRPEVDQQNLKIMSESKVLEWIVVSKIAEYDPWIMVCVDLISPFTLKIQSKSHTLFSTTMIDSTTGLFEIIKETDT